MEAVFVTKKLKGCPNCGRAVGKFKTTAFDQKKEIRQGSTVKIPGIHIIEGQIDCEGSCGSCRATITAVVTIVNGRFSDIDGMH